MRIATQLCTFHLGGVLFGVDVLRVQEVIRAQPMTPVPRSRPAVRGLINLRGQIVAAIDLRTVCGLEPAPADQERMNVVVRTDEGAVSLLVDAIGDVIDIRDVEFEGVPDTIREGLRRVTVGVHKLDGQLLLELDVDRAVETDADEADEATVAALAA